MEILELQVKGDQLIIIIYLIYFKKYVLWKAGEDLKNTLYVDMSGDFKPSSPTCADFW